MMETPIQEVDCWQMLEKLIALVRSNRVFAAKSIWQGLPDAFRIALMRYTVDIGQAEPSIIASCPSVIMTSKFGDFHLCPKLLSDLVFAIPKMI